MKKFRDNPSKMMSLGYSEFVMPLVKGMQEQQEEIQQLKNKLNEVLLKLEELSK